MLFKEGKRMTRLLLNAALCLLSIGALVLCLAVRLLR